MLQQGHRDLAYPRILGHEMVGRIVEIDRDCGLKEGDLCQVWPGIACGKLRPLPARSGQPLPEYEDHGIQLRRRLRRIHAPARG